MAVTNDGNIPFGASIVTINGTAYEAEDIDFHDKTTKIYRRDHLHRVNGGVYIDDVTEGTMTLQLNSASDPIPDNNVVVQIPYRGVTIPFVMTDVQQPQKSNDIRKLKVSLSKVINPANVTTA